LSATAPEGAIVALALNENSKLSRLLGAGADMQSDCSATAGQRALQGSALRRTCLSGAASLRSLKLAREMVSSMDDSGHFGAGMLSAMSAIVQISLSLREVFFFDPLV
jgi:hypothetical protein